MQGVGIICEYNPLHAGHAYHIARARERGVVVCVMSGNFTQRGEAAIIPPVPRAAMAVAAGADLVVELPFPYAASSARYFATAGVRAVAGLGCEMLSFGCECLTCEELREMAKRSMDACEPITRGEYRQGVAGAHFAAMGATPASNDILAIEYARAIEAEFPHVQLYPVRRLGNGYRDTEITTEYPSATALRAALLRGEDVSRYIPPNGVKIWQDAIEQYGVASIERLGGAMLARLRVAPFPLGLADLGGGLLEHLSNAAREATDYATLCRAAATKRYTDGRIRRALLYLLAGVTDADLAAPPAYVRLLAANERGREYLSETRKTRTVPVVTKQADIVALGATAARARALGAAADALYAMTFEKPVRPADFMGVSPYMAQ